MLLHTKTRNDCKKSWTRKIWDRHLDDRRGESQFIDSSAVTIDQDGVAREADMNMTRGAIYIEERGGNQYEKHTWGPHKRLQS